MTIKPEIFRVGLGRYIVVLIEVSNLRVDQWRRHADVDVSASIRTARTRRGALRQVRRIEQEKDAA